MKISVQTGGVTDRFGIEQGYAMIRAAGFDAVDWNLDDHLEARDIYNGTYRGNVYEKPMDEILEFFAFEIAQQRKNELTVTQAHAPFPAFLAKEPELLDYMISVYEACIHVCKAAGCRNLVIHGISPDRNNTDEQIRQMNWMLYTSLISALCQTGVTVCLENLFTRGSSGRGADFGPGHCADAQEAAKLIDRLNEVTGQECFGLCLDTGHLNLLHIDPQLYVATLGKRIKALHIHDNNGLNDQHLAPYNGNICWKNYLSALRDSGYRGDLSFETYAQVHYIDEDALIPSQLQAICAAGKVFRSRILEG